MNLTNFNPQTFLRDHWQKTPLLIRNPWAVWANPLEPDELAGLATEDAVESRLITLARDKKADKAVADARAAAWRAEHGPIPETRFGKLGKMPWTLLVQAVDHHVPAVAALIEPFRFIPNWRIDDVMVSYATDGGGVGPHFDQYDVFLIQGLGRRRWRVGQHCDASSELLPHDDLRLLAEFETTHEWVLEPGDILYVPPGVAHDGVAVGDDCMTYSVGFRAPSRAELIADYCDDLVEELPDDDRYADPDLATQVNPGEITPTALAELHAMVTEALSDRAGFARWFGRMNSTRKYPDIDWQPEEPVTAAALREELGDGAEMCRNPASRFSFVREGAAVLLFVDGESFETAGESAGFAKMLCAQERLTVDAGVSDAVVELLVALSNMGSVAFEDED